MKKNTTTLTFKILMLLIILVIPLNIVSLIVSTVMIRDARTSIINSVRSTIHTYTDNIDQIIYNTNSTLYELNERDSDFLTLIDGQNDLSYQLSKTGLTKTIRNKQTLSPMADYFYFYQENLGDLLVIPHNSSSFDDFLYSNNYFDEGQLSHASWHLAAIDGTPYLTKISANGSLYYGAFIQLENAVSDVYEYLNYPIKAITFTKEAPSSPAPYKNDKHAIIISVKCSRAGLYLNLIFDSSILVSSISGWKWFLIGIIILYIILVPLLYRYIRSWVITPLARLNTAHRQLQSGEENYRITQGSDSAEFEQAYASFNSMAESLQNLRLETISNELARKQMLLDNLQLQIRPHFLLNTFNLLYSMIQTKKTQPAQEMILYLSQYFRYLFQYNKELELFPKEWELILQYLKVSRFQHPDAFTFQYELDPEINLVRIPPLLLHNFFENILSHALVHGQVVHIMFNGFYDNGTVTFQIADDGRGISAREVEIINTGNYDDYSRGFHVGLRNSITRIKYFYNQQGSIHVDSAVNEGTIFTITFPYNLEEDTDNESFDGE